MTWTDKVNIKAISNRTDPTLHHQQNSKDALIKDLSKYILMSTRRIHLSPTYNGQKTECSQNT